MAVEAARQIAENAKDIKGYRFKDVAFYKALVIPSGNTVETQFTLKPIKDATKRFPEWNEFRLFVCENGDWSENCQGSIAVEYHMATEEGIVKTHQYLNEDYNRGAEVCDVNLGSKQFYERLKNLGMIYGSTFQCLTDIQFSYRGAATAVADMCKWEQQQSVGCVQAHVIHPTALDAIFQPIFLAQSRGHRSHFQQWFQPRFGICGLARARTACIALTTRRDKSVNF